MAIQVVHLKHTKNGHEFFTAKKSCQYLKVYDFEMNKKNAFKRKEETNGRKKKENSIVKWKKKQVRGRKKR